MAKRYEAKVEADLLKAFSKIFSSEQDSLSDSEAARRKEWMVIDPANVCACIPKSEEAKRLLSRFMTKDDLEKNKVPSLSFDVEKGDAGKVIMSGYSVEYMLKILKVFEVYKKHMSKNSFKFKSKWDYPAVLSNDEVAFILAPRVEND